MKKVRWIASVVCLLAVGTRLMAASPGILQEQPRVITITAKRFAFSPAEITLKKGETVKLLLNAEDVTHGFFSKALKADELIVPGKTAEVTIAPEKAGKYTVICHHFCGAGHGNMKMTITVVD